MSSPAKAGDPVNTGVGDYWVPAFAGMTVMLLQFLQRII
jgi:hypothetical protein